MAVLGATTLTGCDSIPQFIQTGDKMLFNMQTPPTSWTKDTTPNQHTLRVTNGTASPSGSLTFPQVFTSRPYSAPVTGGGSIEVSLNQASVTPVISPQTSNNSTLLSATTNAFTGTNATNRAHFHVYQGAAGQDNPRAGNGTSPALSNVLQQENTQTGSIGQGGTHTHSIIVTHTHSFPGAFLHGHPLDFSLPHSHPVSPGSFDGFSLTYVDIIIATKN
jgi:hypothetical protein